MDDEEALTELLIEVPEDAPYRIGDWSRSVATVDEDSGRLGYSRGEMTVEVSGEDGEWECVAWTPESDGDAVSVLDESDSFDGAVETLVDQVLADDSVPSYRVETVGWE